MNSQEVTGLLTSLTAANNEQLINTLTARFRNLSASSSSSIPSENGRTQPAATTQAVSTAQQNEEMVWEHEYDEDDDDDEVPSTYDDGNVAWRGVLPQNKRAVTGRGGDLVARLKHPLSLIWWPQH